MSDWTPIQILAVTLALEWILCLWYITSVRILKYIKSSEFISKKINNLLPKNSNYNSQYHTTDDNKKHKSSSVIKNIKKDSTNDKTDNQNK